MRPDNLGDVILTGPVFRSLRRHRPEATLGLFASPGGAAAAELLPWIDEVSVERPVWQDLGGRLPFDPQRELALIDRLRAGRWDAAFILTSFRQAAWPPAYAIYLAGIPVRVGFAREFGGSVLTHPVEPPPDEWHSARRNLALLDGVGIPVDDGTLELAIPAAAHDEVDRRLAGLGIARGEPILVLPGASAPARRIAPERIGRAAHLVARETGRRVVVGGTESEAELVERTLASSPGATTLGLDLSVPEVAALVDAAGIVLCGNSAGLHLADATRRPVVAAYAGTELHSHAAPRSSASVLLTVPVDCAPCYRITCPIGNACLDLSPEVIAANALALLAPNRTTPERSYAWAA
jgi:ADP-heptose:LPS heptosyltransferase